MEIIFPEDFDFFMGVILGAKSFSLEVPRTESDSTEVASGGLVDKGSGVGINSVVGVGSGIVGVGEGTNLVIVIYFISLSV